MVSKIKSDYIELKCHKKIKQDSRDLNDETGPAQLLPPEILVMIFKYVDIHDLLSIAQTCRLWKDASYTKSIWRESIFKLHQDIVINKARPKKTREHYDFNRTLDNNKQFRSYYKDDGDTWCKFDTRTTFWVLFSSDKMTKARLTWPLPSNHLFTHAVNLHRFSQIQTLDLSLVGDQVSDKFISSMLKVLINLRSVKLNSCYKLSNKTIYELVSHRTRRKTLTELYLKRCFNLNNTSLLYISHYCQNLRVLDLSDGCAAVDRIGLLYLVYRMNIKAQRQLNDNSDIYLSTNNAVYYDKDLSDLVSGELVKNQPGLIYYHTLDFTSIPCSDEHIPPLIKSLKVLRLGSSDYLTRVTFEKFFQRLSAIGPNICQLEELDISNNFHITDNVLEMIFSGNQVRKDVESRFVLKLKGCEMITKDQAVMCKKRLAAVLGPSVEVEENCKLDNFSEDAIKDFLRLRCFAN